MPVYSAGKGRWRVRIWHRGTKRDWIVEGKKKDAKDFEAAERRKLLGREVEALRVAPTFSTFCLGRYSDHAAIELKASTWSNRRYDLATLIEHVGDMRLTDITTDRVLRFREARVRDGVSSRTINNELMALSAVLSFAREISVPAPAPKIAKLRARERRHAEAWEPEEVDALLAACKTEDPELLGLLVFMLNTGVRKGEAIGLPREHVDFRRRLVRIWPHDDEGGFDTKSGKGREVPVPEFVMPSLEREVPVKLGSRRRPAAPGTPERMSPWVFPRADGRRFAQFPKKRFGAVVAAAGLTGGPHKTRHTFATHFIAQVPDLYLLGKLLGHSHARVTQLYGHLLADHLERARGAVSLRPSAAAMARATWGMTGDSGL